MKCVLVYNKEITRNFKAFCIHRQNLRASMETAEVFLTNDGVTKSYRKIILKFYLIQIIFNLLRSTKMRMHKNI